MSRNLVGVEAGVSPARLQMYRGSAYAEASARQVTRMTLILVLGSTGRWPVAFGGSPKDPLWRAR